MIKLSTLKPEDQIFVFDKEYSDKRPTLYPVKDFIEAYKERPEDFGNAVVALKVEPKLDPEEIKDLLRDYFADMVIESEYFYCDEAFTIDDLWDDRTLQRVTMFLAGMLRRSGNFVKPGPLEIDYSELAPKKPEAQPDPVPSRKEILKAKRDQFSAKLLDEVSRLEDMLRHRLSEMDVEDARTILECVRVRVNQATFELCAAAYDLDQLEREEKND